MITKKQLLAFVSIPVYCSIMLAQVSTDFSTPLNFIKNEGQWDNTILYQTSSPGWGSNVYLMKNGVSFGFHKTEAKDESKNDLFHNHTEDPSQTMVWNMEFVNSNINARSEGFEKQKSYSNYLKGNDFSKHKSFVPHYKGAQYNEIYQGIDVKYYQGQKGLEYDWIIKPNGNINNIKLKCNGVKSIKINKSQQLVITTPWGDLIEALPESYQTINGQKKLVRVQYNVLTDNTFGYKIIGDYNKNHPLIIDPVTLEWSTYMGTGDLSFAHDVAFDVLGNIYLVGCEYGNFPTTPGAYDQTFNGGRLNQTDIYISKFDLTGALVYSTIIGTDSIDHPGIFGTGGGHSAYVNTAGEVYICGYTSSLNFPITAGVFDNVYGGTREGIVCKLNAAGSNLIYSSFIGGSADEQATAIYVDSGDNAFITGYTNSTDFPTTPAFQSSINAGQDVFFTKINSTGTTLLIGSYLGGNGTERGTDIKADAVGNIYVIGYTESTNFPVTAGVMEATIVAGNTAGFIFKANSTGTAAVFSTYFGGYLPMWGSFSMGYIYPLAMQITSTNEIYLTGYSYCGLNTTAGAFQPSCASSWDAFVARINSLGTSVINMTYFGGSGGGGQTTAYDIILDGYNNVYISGTTAAKTLPITSCAYRSTYTSTIGGKDVFISKLNSTLSTLYYSTYFGDPQKMETTGDMAIYDICGNPRIAIATTSYGMQYPVTSNGYQQTNQTTSQESAAISLFKVSKPTADFTFSTNNCAVNFTDASNGNCVWQQNWTPDAWAWDFGDGQTSTQQNPSHTYAGNGTYNVKLIVNCPADTVEKTVTISSCGVTCTASAGASVITNASCNGGMGSATVSISNGSGGTYTYSWSNGASTITTATSNTELLTSNTYTVTITDGSCTITSTIQITQPTVITPGTITPTPASCGQNNGSALTTVATGGTGTLSYSWSTNATGLTANTLTAATYTLTITDANLCTATATTTINNGGGASISSVVPTNPLCNGGTGSATVNISGGVSGTYTYSWSNGASTVTTATSNQEQLTSNTYTVTVTDGSCTTTTTITITQPNAITLSNPVVSNASCNQNNGSISINLSGGTGLYSYYWSNGISTITNSTTQQLNNLIANTYTLTVADANNCTQTSSITVGNTNGTSVLSATVTNPLCNGGTGSATVTISASTAPYTYSWSNGASSITTATSNQELLTSNSYTLTITDGNNCSAITTLQINQPALLSIATLTKTDASCNQSNGGISITLSGGTTPYTYNWSNGISTISNSIIQQLTNLTTSSYTLTLTDANNCSTTTSTTIVNSNTTVNAAVTANISSNTISEGESIILSAGGGSSYTWTPNSSLTCATCPITIANPTATTTYTLIVKDNLGCADTTNITINVKKPCTGEEDVFIANVFSPNSDGKNDILLIEGNGLTNIYFTIYDRWGNNVFETRDQAQGWDGSVNGNTVNAGTYVYYLKATCKKTLQEIILKGNVSVVK